MIISICGKIGSGKDTVAKMIQRHEMIKNVESGKIFPQSLPTLDKLDTYIFHNNKWKLKKFAEKLKQILSMLTGISREKFEDQYFKKNYAINLVTFEVCHRVEVEGCHQVYDEEHKEVVKVMINKGLHNIYISIRLLLQLFGTDIIRHWLPLAWVNSLFVDYKSTKVKNEDEEYENVFPNWIITDLRFPNEFDGVKKNGGYTIRIIRGDFIPNDSNKHISETALDNKYLNNEFDYVILNNGSLEDLEAEVIEMIHHFNL